MGESVRSFERGLRVIRAFGRGQAEMTLSAVARETELNRATARRLLLTLEELGYVQRRDDLFRLTPRVLDLGYAYLSSFGLPQLALPFLETLSERIHEASSVGVLDGPNVVYVARVPAKRVMTVSIGLGSRFPAYRTSLGRAILASLPDDEVHAVWEESDRSEPTPRTVSNVDDLMVALEEVRKRGFALVDQELEVGVRSIAAPLHDSSGRTVAAVNLSTHVSRTTKQQLQTRFIPELLSTARAIDDVLASQLS